MEIELNAADLGEGFGPYRMGEDEAMMDIVSSANVACGYHAGDPVIMDRTVRLDARGRDIDLGAHVGFPDLWVSDAGRSKPSRSNSPNTCCTRWARSRALRKLRAHLTHMSFHGALGNMAAASYELAEPLVQAVAISIDASSSAYRPTRRSSVPPTNSACA